MVNYKTKAYSFLTIKGKLWESEFAHYRWGLDALSRISKSKVLDVGCGAGALTELWQSKRADLAFVGLDVSPKAIALAKSRQSKVKFHVGSALHLPFRRGSFGGIVCCEVIEHVATPEAMLKSFSRLLTRNGYLYLTTQLEADKRTLVGRVWGAKGIKPKEDIAGHIHTFTQTQLIAMVETAGFKVVKVVYNCHFIGQIEDFIYLLYLRHKKAEVLSFTNYLRAKHGVIQTLGFVLMRVIALVRNIESYLLSGFPGLGIQIIAVKKAT